MARGHKCVTVRDFAQFSLEEMNKIIFSFLRFWIEVKCAVEIRNSTRNASRIRREPSVLTLDSLCLSCVKLKEIILKYPGI